MEIWKDVENYTGKYQVSNLGNIRTLRYKKIIRLKRLYKDNKGYIIVNFYCNKKPKWLRVHRLVAKTFIPNSQNKRVVNHIDGIKYHNHVENLEWATDKENVAHAIKNKLSLIGEINGNAILKEIDIRKIRAMSGIISNVKIASLFKVTPSNIGLIIKNKAWKHVQ